MKNKTLKLSLLLFLNLWILSVQAQQVVTTSGGEASGTGGTSNYSIGQVVYTTINGAGNSVAQGVQQPYEISVATGLEENLGIDLEFTAYPNPAKEFLTLKTDNNQLKQLSYQLTDIKGTLIETKKMEGNEASINMQSLLPATYFLIVLDNQKVVRTFKIIKN